MAPKKAAPKKQTTLFEFGGKENFKFEEEEEDREEDFEADIDVRHEEAAIPTDAQRTNPERLTLTLNLRK